MTNTVLQEMHHKPKTTDCTITINSSTTHLPRKSLKASAGSYELPEE